MYQKNTSLHIRNSISKTNNLELVLFEPLVFLASLCCIYVVCVCVFFNLIQFYFIHSFIYFFLKITWYIPQAVSVFNFNHSHFNQWRIPSASSLAASKSDCERCLSGKVLFYEILHTVFSKHFIVVAFCFFSHFRYSNF